MKRTLLFFSFLFLMCSFVSFSSIEAKNGQGITYYKAGFSQVAKPLLLEDISASPAITAEVSYYLGNIFFEENLADSAAFYFKKGLVAYPTNSLNSVGLAMLKMKSDLVGAGMDIKNILKQKGNNKNADVMIAISKAYLVNGFVEQAIVYQEKAKKIKPKYSPVYVLLGDIEFAKKNIGPACSNYEQAILFDGTNKEAYVKYARAYKNVNPTLSIEKLKELKAKDSSFSLVDKEMADVYYSMNNFDEAAQLYESYLQSGNSNVQDKTKYAMTLFLKQDYAKSLEVANLGLKNAPRNPAFNRLAMYNNVALKQFEQGLKAADLFFNKSENPDVSYFDYTYFGQALRQTKQIDSAIVQYQKAFKLDSTKVDLFKDISDMYSEKGDYKSAITSYVKYCNSLSEEKKKNADVIMDLGKLYYSLGTAQSTASKEKKAALTSSDSIFALVAADEPNNYRGNYWRARVNSALDPETTNALAKPFYEQTATFVESKADSRYNSILIESYSYLGYCSLLKKDYPLSKSYWNKILAIDPNNATAKKATEGIDKALKGKK